MTNKLIESVDGKREPKQGEVAVYWSCYEYTDIFSADGFEETDQIGRAAQQDFCVVVYH